MLKILISIATVASLLSACSGIPTFRLDVQQGNAIEDSKVAQIREGMTPEQVEFPTGVTPGPRHLRPRGPLGLRVLLPTRPGPTETRRVSVFFEDGRVAGVEDTRPSAETGD
jgi:outer membrane protein assembly factor BamE